MTPAPEYRVILAADIAGSAGRGDSALLSIREVLFTALREALECSGIGWAACIRQDTGDGVQMIMPAGAAKARLVHPLCSELAARLRARNRLASPAAQVQVRMALHAGDIRLSPEGTAVGRPLEVAARLLDAPPARDALACGGIEVPLAVIVSEHFYEATVPHGYPGVEPGSFRRVGVAVKEYAAGAWLWLPPVPGQWPASADPVLPADGAGPAESPPAAGGPDAGEPPQPARGQGVRVRIGGNVYGLAQGDGQTVTMHFGLGEDGDD